jgi:hypothetical protein
LFGQLEDEDAGGFVDGWSRMVMVVALEEHALPGRDGGMSQALDAVPDQTGDDLLLLRIGREGGVGDLGETGRITGRPLALQALAGRVVLSRAPLPRAGLEGYAVRRKGRRSLARTRPEQVAVGVVVVAVVGVQPLGRV